MNLDDEEQLELKRYGIKRNTEIVSSNSKPRDYMTKLFKYRTSGVREYWIVDSMKQMISVYAFESDTVEQYNFCEDVPVGIYEGFTIKVGKL